MKKTKKNAEGTCRNARETGTRNAVETAIDLSKDRKRSTWEGQFKQVADRISRWDSKNDK